MSIANTLSPKIGHVGPRATNAQDAPRHPVPLAYPEQSRPPNHGDTPMETGNTAVHVSPGQEEAMRDADTFKRMASDAADAIVNADTFKRMASDAADAIVNAGTLRVEMADLRASFDELKRDMEYTRSRNKELNTHLADVRRQRDEAEQKLSQTAAELEIAKRTGSEIDAANTRQAAIIMAKEEEIISLRKERDDYGLDAMKLRDELGVAQAKLAEIEEFAQRFMKPAAPMPPVLQEPPQEPSTPPGSTTRRVYELDSEYSWGAPHIYDVDCKLWYNEVAA